MENKVLFNFLLRKDICFESVEQHYSDLWLEDEFNSDLAEKALDIACEIYQEKPGEDLNDTIDKRHEFVSEFLEHCRNEVVRKWACNLGYVHVKGYVSTLAHSEICRDYEKKIKELKEKLKCISDTLKN